MSLFWRIFVVDMNWWVWVDELADEYVCMSESVDMLLGRCIWGYEYYLNAYERMVNEYGSERMYIRIRVRANVLQGELADWYSKMIVSWRVLD